MRSISLIFLALVSSVGSMWIQSDVMLILGAIYLSAGFICLSIEAEK